VGLSAAVVVAHPDDETLWGAGWIIGEVARGGHVTVICCSTPKRDPERAERFHDACKVLGASGIVLNNIDRGEHQPLDLRPLDWLHVFNYVVTHNANGEYGHKHHSQVHQHVFANYGGPKTCFGRGAIGVAMPHVLNDADLAQKLKALQCYSHVSSADGMPKWRALIDRYFDGSTDNLRHESYTKGVV
jgi:hypothetical protein